jgi:hypothetical protein
VVIVSLKILNNDTHFEDLWGTKIFTDNLINLILDEAHVVKEWGSTFHSNYLLCHYIVVYWNVLPKINALLIYIIAYYRILCLLRQLQLWELNHLVGTTIYIATLEILSAIGAQNTVE